MPDFLRKILLWFLWGAIGQLDPGWKKRVEDEAAQRKAVEANEVKVQAAIDSTNRDLAQAATERTQLEAAEAVDDKQLVTLKEGVKKIDDEPNTTVDLAGDDALRADLRQPH